MIQDLFISESQNNISSFGKIRILTSIPSFGFWAVVPVNAIALNDDFVFGQEKIDHELIKHDNLFSEREARIGKCLKHFLFKVGSLSRFEPVEMRRGGTLLTAILRSIFPAWEGLKLLSASLAHNINLLFPVVISLSALCAQPARVVKAFDGAKFLLVFKCASDAKAFFTLLASKCYLLTLIGLPFVSKISVVALIRTVCRNIAIMARNFEFLIAYFARFFNDGCVVAFLATKNVFRSFFVTLKHFYLITTNITWVRAHKKSPDMSVGCLSRAYRQYQEIGKTIAGFAPTDKRRYALDNRNYNTFYGEIQV